MLGVRFEFDVLLGSKMLDDENDVTLLGDPMLCVLVRDCVAVVIVVEAVV